MTSCKKTLLRMIQLKAKCILMLLLMYAVPSTAQIIKYKNDGNSLQRRLDSLEAVLSTYRGANRVDTSVVNLILSIANIRAYEMDTTKKALVYANEARAMAQKLGYAQGIAIAWITESKAFMEYNDLTNGIRCCNNGIQVHGQLCDTAALIDDSWVLGTLYFRQGWLDKVLECFLRVEGLYTSFTTKTQAASDRFAWCLYQVAALYFERNDLDLSRRYALQASRLSDSLAKQYPAYKREKYPYSGITFLGLLVNITTKQQRFDESLQFAQESLAIANADSIGRDYSLARSYELLANACYNNSQYAEGLRYALAGLSLNFSSGSLKKDELAMGSLHDIAANNYFKLARFREALTHAEQALQLNLDVYGKTPKTVFMENYKFLVAVNDSLHQPEKSVQYYRLITMLQDTLLQSERRRLVADMQAQREAIQLRRETEQQKAQRDTFFAASVGVVLFIIGAGLAFYFRKRATFTRQLLEESERTSRTVLQATIEAIEQERRRIQRELHDGAGAKLSAVKIGLSSFQSLIRTYQPDRAQGYEKSMSAFTEAITEIKRISHDMLPPILEKQGLAVALEELVQSVPSTIDIQILLNVEAILGKRYNASLELSVYRLTQEILNNCLKHADAASLVLFVGLEQRTTEGNVVDWLTLIGEDEGKGFHIEEISTRNGSLGLGTMQSRVQYMGGTLSIISEPGRGTCVTAKIPLPSP